MNVEVEAVTRMQIELDSVEALKMLCETLYMDFVLDENTDYFVKKDEYGENGVYVLKNGCDHKIDDRGDLFVALRNVAVNIVPNVDFRSADYIY